MRFGNAITSSILVLLLCLLGWSFCFAQEGALTTRTEDKVRIKAECERLRKEAAEFASKHEFDPAQQKLEECFLLEVRVYGNAHIALLDTLHLRRVLATESDQFDQAIQLRKQALEIGRRLPAKEDYRLRELQWRLNEAEHRNSLSREQQQILQNASREYSQAVLLSKKGAHRRAIEALNKTIADIEMLKDETRFDYSLYCDSLSLRALLYSLLEGYQNAATDHDRLLSIQERNLGKGHPDYADSLDNLGTAYYAMNDYQRAERFYLEAKGVRERIFGTRHKDFQTSLRNLVRLYSSLNDLAKAETLSLDSKSISEKLFGQAHPEYAQSLDDLAHVYSQKNDFPTAKRYFLEAKSIRERLTGRNHSDYLTSVKHMIDLSIATSDLDSLESCLQEYMFLSNSMVTKNYTSLIEVFQTCARSYTAMGEIQNAIQLLVECREQIIRHHGKLSREYVSCTGSLANLYLKIQDFPNAEAQFVEAKAVCERVSPDSLAYVQSVIALASLYRSVADYSRALSLFSEALSVQERVLSKDHPDYAVTMVYIGSVYFMMADLSKAESYLVEAKEILERKGDGYISYLLCLNNLAEVYRSKKEYSKAEHLYLTVKSTHEKVLGEQVNNSHLYALSLNNLASVYFSQRDYQRAEPLAIQAMALREKILGNQHQAYMSSLFNVAALYISTGRSSIALPMYEQSLKSFRYNLDSAAMILSEHQQLILNRTFRVKLDSFLRACTEIEHVPSSATRNALLWKGSTSLRLRSVRVTANEPAIAEQFSELRTTVARISALTQLIPSPKYAEKWRERLAKLTTEKEQLEAEMMRKSATFAKADKQITLEDIQRAIPKDGVLVDYLEFNGKEGPELVASIVYPSAEPQMVFLGSNKELGARIDGWLGSHGDTPEAQQAGQELRKQLWEPLLPLIENAKMILVSTDGDLGRFPIAALPGKETGKYLIEEHRLVMIPVPQLLPELMESNSPSDLPRGLLAMGAIDYNAEPDSAPKIQPAESETKKSLDSLAMRTRSELPASVRGNSKWDQLDATGPEVDFVTKLFTQKHNSPDSTIVKLDRSAASEASFRALATGSKFIHLATHGFFADSDKKSALSSEMVAQSAQDEMFSLGDKHKIIRGHNPGQLSGLVFAGANRPAPVITIDNLTENHGENDGILTADEIAFLRLEGCELVVLSACQTGLGATAGGEGILGLQRSFQLAGARSVVSSLWNVNDEATNQLMQLFYTNVWTHKQSKLDALRNAQLDMLNFYDSDTHKLSADKIRADRSQPIEMKLVPKKDTNSSKSIDRSKRLSPQFWAAFQLSGDWR